MRKFLVCTLLICMIFNSQVSALFLGQLRPAQTCGLGSLTLGSSVGIFEDAFTLVGRAQYGVGRTVDLTIDFGLVDHQFGDDLDFIIGSDLQFQVAHNDLGNPLDIAVGGRIEYFTFDTKGGRDMSNLGIGATFAASRPISTRSGFIFIPYGRLNVRVDRYDNGRDTDSEFNIGFNAGTVFQLSGTIDLVGEVQADDQFGFLLGLNFLMW